MTHSRPQLQALLARHGLQASRALGQNFVADPNTVRRIVRLAGVEPGDRVVEVGAGLGSLTLALAEAGAEVTAVEMDQYLLPVLREVVDGHPVTVVEGDATRLDWGSLLAGHERWKLVANLPYNVATPIVCDLLDGVPAIAEYLVMVQLEVAERLAAHVGDAAYGAVSVKVDYWAQAKVVGKVSPSVFIPRPRVHSGLVRIVRRPQPAVDPAECPTDRFFEIVRAGFAHRRKMLRGNLAGLVAPGAFDAAGVAPTARAEELDVAAWGRLAGWSS